MTEKPTLYLPAQREGGVHHYHHFLYGYYLPIILDISLSNNDPIYHTDCEESSNNVFANTPLPFKMEERIKSTWQNDMTLLPHIRAKNKYNIIKPKCFDGGNVKFDPNIWPSVNRKIDSIFNIEEQDDEYILFIDRGEPDPNFNEIVSKVHVRDRAGSLRRTFTNNDEIYDCLSKILPTKRAVLEETDYKEQITLFRNATYIFAQHGAALSNLIYCEKLKGMLEVCNTSINRQATWFDFVTLNILRCKRRKILVSEEYVYVNPKRLEREMKLLISIF